MYSAYSVAPTIPRIPWPHYSAYSVALLVVMQILADASVRAGRGRLEHVAVIHLAAVHVQRH
jgi:hypothetical protein